MKRLSLWCKKVYHAGNTRKGCFVMGTFIGLLTWLTRGIISIDQGEAVIIAFLYSIISGIMAASPLILVGIIKYPKTRGKKEP